MKTKKRILAILLAFSMTAMGSGYVYAAETVSSATASENETDEIGNEEMSEDIAASEDLTPEAGSERADLENTEDQVFNGMPDGFMLGEAELLGKNNITEHNVVSELEGLTPGVDYVEDEVIFSCDDPEYAKLVAEAYNGTLDSCELGVAVIKLDTTKVSVMDAVAAGADPATSLPPVDANFKCYLTDPVKFRPAHCR